MNTKMQIMLAITAGVVIGAATYKGCMLKPSQKLTS